MRALLQRVKTASCLVEGKLISEIEKGFLVFLGIREGDGPPQVKRLAEKLSLIRVFEDDQGKLNLSLKDVRGEVLVISQFTLYADCKKGRRPSFHLSARPEAAENLYKEFLSELGIHGLAVKSGVFGAKMEIELINDGPVTIMLDSDEL